MMCGRSCDALKTRLPADALWWDTAEYDVEHSVAVGRIHLLVGIRSEFLDGRFLGPVACVGHGEGESAAVVIGQTTSTLV